MDCRIFERAVNPVRLDRTIAKAGSDQSEGSEHSRARARSLSRMLGEHAINNSSNQAAAVVASLHYDN
jgi:hypothetical protein